jgi:hypothetical protein
MTHTLIQRLQHDLEDDRATLDRTGITRWLMCFSANKPLSLEHPRIGKIHYDGGGFEGSPELIFDQFVRYSIDDLVEKHTRLLECALNDVDFGDLDVVADQAAGMLWSVRGQLLDRAAVIKGRLKGNGISPRRAPVYISPHEQRDMFSRLRARVAEIKRRRSLTMSISPSTVGRFCTHVQSVQGVGYHSFPRQLKRLSEFLRDSEFAAITSSLAHGIDAKKWVEAARVNAEGGEACLEWPDDRISDLGYSIALIHHLASLTPDEILDFACDFYFVSSRFDDNLGRLSDEFLAPFYSNLVDYLQDKGLLDIETKASAIQYNSVTMHQPIGVALQQGTTSSSQTVTFDIDVGAAVDAIGRLESELTGARLDRSVLTELQAELTTLRAQLSKASPNPSVLAEVGKSARAILEGMAAGVLTPDAITAASMLWVALGIG